MAIKRRGISNVSLGGERFKKGFTLIELMTVISIMGILSSMASLQFRRQADYAQEVNIRNNVQLVESAVKETLILDKEKFEGWPLVEMSSMEQLQADEMLFDQDGRVGQEDVLTAIPYRQIPGNFVQEEAFSTMAGAFYTDRDGVIYYANQ